MSCKNECLNFEEREDRVVYVNRAASSDCYHKDLQIMSQKSESARDARIFGVRIAELETELEELQTQVEMYKKSHDIIYEKWELMLKDNDRLGAANVELYKKKCELEIETERLENRCRYHVERIDALKKIISETREALNH